MSENVVAKPLSHKQARAVSALLASRTIAEAAQAAGVNERTINRWMDNATFRTALVEAEAGAIDEATRRLLWLQAPAIDILGSILDDAKAAPAIRLRAAQLVLDYMLKLRELRNIETRLSDLEQAVYAV